MVASLGLRAAGYKLLASGLRAAWHYAAWQGATGRRATGCRLHGKVSKGVGLQARLPYLPPPSSMSYLLPSYYLFLHSPSCPPPSCLLIYLSSLRLPSLHLVLCCYASLLRVISRRSPGVAGQSFQATWMFDRSSWLAVEGQLERTKLLRDALTHTRPFPPCHVCAR